jgi:acylphosphatase
MAKELGLTGIVSNTDDGGIKIVAEGDDQILSDFSKKITEVSPFSLTLIDNFFMKWHKATGEYNDFFIKDSVS